MGQRCGETRTQRIGEMGFDMAGEAEDKLVEEFAG